MISIRRIFILFTSLIVVLIVTASFTGKPHRCGESAGTWGFFGHKKINELAVYTLPKEMFGFYKENINYLIEHSVDPDKRRNAVKGEAECHYIDMDHYITKESPNPFDNVPRRWTDAVAKFSEDSLREHGIVPWNVYNVTMKLTNAFKNEDINRILRLSAELGHYIGDAHVPLHTTSNYNGQQTGQRGIHGFWESRLPELYSEDYDFFVGKSQYIKAPLNYIWDRVEESFAAVDSVLGFERDLNSVYSEDQKYSFESRGQMNVTVYSSAYSDAYNNMLDGQVERRMRKAVVSVGSYWYTAWVDAGQPDLSKFVLRDEGPDADSLGTEGADTREKLKVREHE
ncbi:MAG: zinc dependent phospholipase C family protein [Flavobacteriales bacterium]|nr:zinc dependent phospholipase C family protein [Flavobacteriales bacterium]